MPVGCMGRMERGENNLASARGGTRHRPSSPSRTLLLPPVVDMVGEEMGNATSGLEFSGSAFNWCVSLGSSKKQQWP